MNNIKNWIIAVLAIVCVALCWSIKHKEAQIKTIEECYFQQISDTNNLVEKADEIIDEVCTYIESKYGEYLPDTIWEGDVYDEYLKAKEWALVDYD